MNDLQPSRWCVVWGERMERESYFADKALADAYAAAHHGVIVPLAALKPWPFKPWPTRGEAPVASAGGRGLV